jgi:hypothetical protein
LEEAMTRAPRKPKDLSESLHRLLNSYALAASAAGVGLLALAAPAEGEIVYTPGNKNVPNCRANQNLCFKLDLNHDGIIDFMIPFLGTTYKGTLTFQIIPAKNQSKNRIWGTLSSSYGGRPGGKHGVASALNSGVSIGQNFFKFQPGHQDMAIWCDACGPSSAGGGWGQWRDVTNKYLGLKFFIKRKVHYGWARLTTKPGKKYMIVTMTGYAYETVAGRSIITGRTKGPDVITVQPGSLGALAVGSR